MGIHQPCKPEKCGFLWSSKNGVFLGLVRSSQLVFNLGHRECFNGFGYKHEEIYLRGSKQTGKKPGMVGESATQPTRIGEFIGTDGSSKFIYCTYAILR